MNKLLIAHNLDRVSLVSYVVTQISNLCPDGRATSTYALIDRYMDSALARLAVCINAVKTWTPGVFDYLHSSQYCTFLYFLSNTIWQESKDIETATKLFLLNKHLNGIDLFFEIAMPDIFFIGHSTGIVLSKAKYSNYFVIYQNSTVGKNHGVAPSLGEGVIMYPNSAIIGRCEVGKEVVISQGVSVVNKCVPESNIVFSGVGNSLCFKPMKRKIITDFFRF